MFQYLGDYLIELISLLLPLSLIGIVVLIAIILIQYYFYLNFIKRYKLIKKIYDKIYDKSLKLKHVNYNEIKACFKNEQEVQEITTEIMRRKFILGLLLKIDYFINKIFWKKKLSFMQDNLSDKQQLVYRSVRLLKLFPLIVISFILAVILLAIIIVILNKFMLTFFIFAFIFIFLIIFVVSYFSYLDFKKRVAKEKDLIKLNKQIKDEIERNRQLAIGIIVLIGILGFAAFFIYGYCSIFK